MKEVLIDDAGQASQIDAHQQILPVASPTTPYWRTQLHPIDDLRSSETLPAECDVAIVGSGMAGVTTAYHICEQTQDKPPSILMLEARQVCSGATGRNGVVLIW